VDDPAFVVGDYLFISFELSNLLHYRNSVVPFDRDNLNYLM
jgi:hypothetical protein